MHKKEHTPENRLGLLDSSPDPLHAQVLLRLLLYHITDSLQVFQLSKITFK